MRTALLLAISTIAFAQVEDRSTEHKSYSGVHELIIDNITGDIELTAYSGASIEMDVEKTLSARSNDRLAIARKEISLAERREGGLVELTVDGPFRCHCGDNSVHFHGDQLYRFKYTFKVRVPRAIALELHTVNGSRISVEGTAGDFHVSNVNGSIDMRDVEGAGEVHTVNGEVKVTFARNPTGATSFRSVNGTLDVAFRANLSADLKLKTFNGGMYTDFPVTTSPVAAHPEQRDGKMIWGRNRTTAVRIGSGGPELSFDTLNGQILIRKRD